MTKAKKRRGKKPATTPGEMTAQQLAFCVEFVANAGNGHQAALSAGYAAAGAKVRAHRLLQLPRIRDKVAELTARAATEATDKLEAAAVTTIAEQAITAEVERSKIDTAVETLRARVMKRLESIGFTELPELVTWTDDQVTFIPSADLPDTARGSVQSIKSKQDEVITDEGDKILRRTTMEVKQHNPMPALEKLMQLCQMVPKDEKPGSTVAVGVQVIVSGGPTGIETGAIRAANYSETIPAAGTLPVTTTQPVAVTSDTKISNSGTAGPRPWNPGRKVRSPHASPLSAIAERARAALSSSPEVRP